MRWPPLLPTLAATPATPLAQEPLSAGSIPHVPPRPPPQEGDWRFTRADYNEIRRDLTVMRAHHDFFQQSFTNYHIKQHHNAYDFRGLLHHQLANLPAQATYEAPTYPQFQPPPRGDGANE